MDQNLKEPENNEPVPVPEPMEAQVHPVAVASRIPHVRDTTGFLDFRQGQLVCNPEGAVYELVKEIGKGGYGQVVKTFDKTRNYFFALKIVRNTERFPTAGFYELKVLKYLDKLDPNADCTFCKTLCAFTMNKHVCFGMPLLGMSIWKFIQINKNNQFPVYQTRHIMYQLGIAVNFLHEHKIIHTDIKVDNILFVTSNYQDVNVQGQQYFLIKDTRVCLVDYGAAKITGEWHSGMATTRGSRAPEVVLKRNWNDKIDIWALGCVLYELMTGYQLIQVHTDLEQLKYFELIFGQFPPIMTESGPFMDYFKFGKVDMTKLPTSSAEVLDHDSNIIKRSFRLNLGERETQDMIDLLLSLLKLDSNERLGMDQIMHHKFLQDLPTIFRLKHGIANAYMISNPSGLVTGITCSCPSCESCINQERNLFRNNWQF